MKAILSVFLFCTIFAIVPTVLPSQTSPTEEAVLGTIKKFNRYRKVYRGFEMANKFKTTYNDCIANGFSEDQCSNALALCLTLDFIANYYPGFPAATFRRFGLFELFKLNCGDGICFQCCYVPDANGGGCHTSFIGFPVINCNENYGAGTRDAGLAKVLSGEPGDPCISTPQTCSHIPVCLLGLGQSLIDQINNDPDHIMKTDMAIEQRARHYAEDFLNSWSEFITDFSSGDPLIADEETIVDDLSLDDINDFLSVRGSLHWKNFIDSLFNFNGDLEPFAVLDSANNQILTSPSIWNYLRQQGLANILASVPNLYNRLAYTGSKIWLQDDLNNYLGNSDYTDSLFLSTMSPIAFYFYKTNPKVQDYRTLSVPLLGENENNTWTGDTLGTSPIFDVYSTYDFDNYKIQLKIEVSDFGVQFNNLNPIEGVTYWGDGTVTEFSIGPTIDTVFISHAYKKEGNYQAFITLQNTTGLRGVKFLEINVPQSSSIELSELPILTRLSVDSAIIKTSLFTFVEKIGVNIFAPIDNKKILLGAKSPKTIWNNGTLNYDAIVAHNNNMLSIDTIIIEPILVNSNDDYGYCYLKFKKISGNIYNAAINKDTLIEIPFFLDSIKLIDEYGQALNNSEFLQIDADGNISIQFSKDNIDVEKIYIPIDKETLKMNYIGPSQSISWSGKNKFYIEESPNHFIEYFQDTTSNVNEFNLPVPLARFYPNPTSNSIIIDFQDQTYSNEKCLTIYNSIGLVVKRIILPINQQQLFLRVDDLPSGAYFINVQCKTTSITEKIIKI